MNQNDIKNAPQYAWKNRKAVEESPACGCYQCLAVFSSEDIEEWTDYGNTAMCPKCGCDCVIAQSHAIPLDTQHLKQIHDYWLAK